MILNRVRVTYCPVLAVSPFLAFQYFPANVRNHGVGVCDVVMKLGHDGMCACHIVMNIRNEGVGVHNVMPNFGNEGVGVLNATMDVGNDSVGVYCKLSLGMDGE